MATYQKPITGDWYINADGKFFRIWGLVYEQGLLNRVVIQQLSGKRYHIALSNWRKLDLVRYPPTGKSTISVARQDNAAGLDQFQVLAAPKAKPTPNIK